MKPLGVLCTLLLFAMLRSGTCIEPVRGKLLPTERLLDNLDVLQEDVHFDPLTPVSQHSELFGMAKRIAQKKDSLQGREGNGVTGPYGHHRNNMDRFEANSQQFLDLSIDIVHSSVYLLSNYTRFVRNANNKYIIVFE